MFFWRGERKKEPSKWVGPGYVVGLQGPNAWVAVGGRCFLVAGEHLREASGDEKHYGDPQIQKAIALFKKVPKEATFEDLILQPDPTEEPMEVERQYSSGSFGTSWELGGRQSRSPRASAIACR